MFVPPEKSDVAGRLLELLRNEAKFQGYAAGDPELLAQQREIYAVRQECYLLGVQIVGSLLAGEPVVLTPRPTQPRAARLTNPPTIELRTLARPAECQACHKQPAMGTLVYPMVCEPYLLHICSTCLADAVGGATWRDVRQPRELHWHWSPGAEVFPITPDGRPVSRFER